MKFQSTEIPSAAQAMLSAHAIIRNKIEAANLAVMEAVRAALEFGDPCAANYFGADNEQLKVLADTSGSKLRVLMMTGIPIFSVRLATPDFKAVLDNKEGDDAALKVLLKSFGEQLSITSI